MTKLPNIENLSNKDEKKFLDKDEKTDQISIVKIIW